MHLKLEVILEAHPIWVNQSQFSFALSPSPSLSLSLSLSHEATGYMDGTQNLHETESKEADMKTVCV